MRRKFLVSLLGVIFFMGSTLIHASPVQAAGNNSDRLNGVPVSLLVELFTSQGCPNSPKADKLLSTLKGRGGVLALSWPIDYWDRFGWKDTHATPENSDRQTAYNKHMGKSGVSTPQMIFNGSKAINGRKKRKVTDYVSMTLEKSKLLFAPELSLENKVITVSLSENSDLSGYFMRLVYFQDKSTVDVQAGLNRGKTLSYHNVVRISPDAMEWDGSAMTWTFDMPENLNNSTHLAVIVQKGFNHGMVKGASVLKLP